MRIAAGLVALLTLAGSVSMLAQASAAAPLSKELTALQGHWVIESFNGQEVPAGAAGMALVIAGDSYQVVMGGEVNETGLVKVIDATKSPMWVDLIIKTGDDAGSVQPGLFDVKADRMAAGFATPGNGTRPANMDAAELYVTGARKK